MQPEAATTATTATNTIAKAEGQAQADTPEAQAKAEWDNLPESERRRWADDSRNYVAWKLYSHPKAQAKP